MVITVGNHVRMSTSVNLPSSSTVILPEHLTDDAVTRLGPSLRRTARKHVGRELRLDGRDVRTVSVRGVALLVAVSRLTAIRGNRVVLVEPSAPLTERLVSLGLYQRFSLAGHDVRG